MTGHSRRNVLRGASAAAVGLTTATLGATPAAAESDDCPPPLGPVAIGPDDPRYQDLIIRGYNRRFANNPDEVRVVGSTEQVVHAVRDAVRTGRRLAVRGGGHGFEGFVDDPAVRMLIDMSGMTRVYYDPRRRAFAVEAGATLGEVYRRLYLGWGVTVPAGWCPQVGAGGHVAGGGYGVLCRLHGLAVDHLYGVEVVVVDRDGTARSVVATREESDPNRELWWAHTGGGAGTYGVVTRYWFRTPGATGSDPAALLPKPPASTLSFSVDWPWADIPDVAAFTRLMDNHGQWSARNSAPDSPYAGYYSEFLVTRRLAQNITLIGKMAGADAEQRITDLVAEISAGVRTPPTPVFSRQPWLADALLGSPGDPGPIFRLQVKSGYLRKPFTDRQLAVIYRYLNMDDYPGGLLSINSYGGKVNTVPVDATAVAHRDSILKLLFVNGWPDAASDGARTRWLREFYRDLFADTGGVPAPSERTDGAFINYADTDLADPAWNTSGVPWHTLYFGENYPRLQRIKAHWDPRNVFRHALSVRPG
ncbi:FAD-binding oxidoreductase [Actinophytocola sediminis]